MSKTPSKPSKLSEFTKKRPKHKKTPSKGVQTKTNDQTVVTRTIYNNKNRFIILIYRVLHV